jgi:hypothetical protein
MRCMYPQNWCKSVCWLHTNVRRRSVLCFTVRQICLTLRLCADALEVLRLACMERAHSFLRLDTACSLLCEAMSEEPGASDSHATSSASASAAASTASTFDLKHSASEGAQTSLFASSPSSSSASPASDEDGPSLLVAPAYTAALRQPLASKSVHDRTIALALGRGTVLVYIEEHILDIIRSQGMLEISCKPLSLNLSQSSCGHALTAFLELPAPALVAILESSRLRVEEIALFHAVLRWGQYQLQQLSKRDASSASSSAPLTLRSILRDILPFIRFALMPMNVILTEVQPSGVLTDSQLVQVFTLIHTPSELRAVNFRSAQTKPRRAAADEVGVAAAGAAVAAVGAPAPAPAPPSYLLPALFVLAVYLMWFVVWPCASLWVYLALSLPLSIPLAESVRALTVGLMAWPHNVR